MDEMEDVERWWRGAQRWSLFFELLYVAFIGLLLLSAWSR